jgi:hypothetical protein
MLKRRQYVLIALIIAIGSFNFWRMRSARRQLAAPPAVARGTSPVWPLFDDAVAVRDAPDAQFQPALQALNKAVDSASTSPEIADLQGCQTWLLFYRQEHLHPSTPTKLAQQQHHLDSCLTNHRDIAQ